MEPARDLADLALEVAGLELGADSVLAFLPNDVANVEFDPDSDLNLGQAQLHSAGAFDLAPDEELELRFRPADCDYWSVFLANYWFEPYQYRHRRGPIVFFWLRVREPLKPITCTVVSAKNRG